MRPERRLDGRSVGEATAYAGAAIKPGLIVALNRRPRAALGAPIRANPQEKRVGDDFAARAQLIDGSAEIGF